MSDRADDPIATGRAAWQRLQERERKSWSDWLLVGHALIAGRAEAMQKAAANRPLGWKYNRIFGEWLRSNGFDSITNQARYRVILVIDHIREIQTWRDSLDDAQRRRMNHPGAVWFAWRRATRPGSIVSKRQHVVSGAKPRGCARAIHLPQDMLRRAAAAIREAHSNDCIVLARRCLEAALRNELDLLELLPDPPPKPAPQRFAASGPIVHAPA